MGGSREGEAGRSKGRREEEGKRERGGGIAGEGDGEGGATT